MSQTTLKLEQKLAETVSQNFSAQLIKDFLFDNKIWKER